LPEERRMNKPTPEQVTINTIRDLVERVLKIPQYPLIDDYRVGHTSGYCDAMRDIKSILDMNGRPTGEPVHLGP
jgi:hypothetical protein